MREGGGHISLHIFQQRLQLCFKPRLNQRSTQETMGIQSDRSPDFRNFGTFNLGVSGKMTFGCSPCGEPQRII
jgi:hypothetical protein